MKTIEERANEYADTKVIPYDDPMYDAWRQAIMNDYLAGAKDQKNIDIEKACDWLRARNVITEDSLEGFRKAMEKEE